MKQIVALMTALALCFTHAPAANVTIIAGTGIPGFSGDGGPAAQAQLNNVFGVARGPDGLVYLCDTENHRVRCIQVDGTMETCAGNGAKGHQGDGGRANQAALNSPYEMAWDRSGNLFIVKLANNDVRRVNHKW